MSLDRFGLLQFGSDTSCSPSPCWIGQLHQPKARAKAETVLVGFHRREDPVFQDPASIEMMELWPWISLKYLKCFCKVVIVSWELYLVIKVSCHLFTSCDFMYMWILIYTYIVLMILYAHGLKRRCFDIIYHVFFLMQGCEKSVQDTGLIRSVNCTCSLSNELGIKHTIWMFSKNSGFFPPQSSIKK